MTGLLTPREREVISRREWPSTPLLIDHMFLPVLVELEQTGAPFDSEGMSELHDELEAERVINRDALYVLAGHEFNLNASGQKARFLFEELGLKVGKRTPKGQGVVDKTALAELDHPAAQLLLAYTGATKLQQFVDKLPKVAEHYGGRIKYALNNTSVETGRLSSGSKKMGKWSVNVQQIPVRTDVGKRIRTHFVASAGRVLYAVDASQFQLRIAAVDSGDPGFIDSFNRGIDTYNATAIDAFGETNSTLRRVMKTYVLGALFGATEAKSRSTVAKDLGRQVADDPRISGAYRRFFEIRPRLAQRIEEVRAFVRKSGYAEDYFGRRNIYPLNGNRAAIEKNLREAYNMYVQGPEASIVKIFMAMIHRAIRRAMERAWAAWRLRQTADVILQVHDEGVYDVDADCDGEGRCGRTDGPHAHWFEVIVTEVEDELNDLLKWPVRIVLDVGHGANWGKAH